MNKLLWRLKFFLNGFSPRQIGIGGGEGDPPPVPVPNDIVPPEYTPPDINMAEALPPDMRGKPFFKDKSFSDVITEHANLQTLIGQRPAGIPGDDASDEDWGKFIEAIKPKSADEYGFPETEYSKAGKRNEGYETAIRTMANEVGVPKRQFPKFVEMIEQHLGDADKLGTTQTEGQKAARETEFEGLMDKAYPQNKQAVIDRTKKMMVESVDPAHKEKVGEVLKDISNEHLFALTAVLDGVYKKHIAEDGPPGEGDNSSGDAANLMAEMQKIQGSPEYTDFRMPGHDAAKLRVPELAKQIAALQKSP